MTPNTRKPTSDEAKSWLWDELKQGWMLVGDYEVIKRYYLTRGNTLIVPYSAIPDPNNEQQQGEG